MSIWSSVIGAGSSLIGNLFNKGSNDSANKTNMRIAQMNNEFNERMLDKQMDYNSAASQVQRFKDAGLNPSLMMQGQGAGQVTSTPQASQVSVQPNKYDFSGVAESIIQSKQLQMMSDKTAAEVNSLNTQSDVARARASADVALAYERTRDQKLRNTLMRDTMTLQKQQMNADYQNTLRQGRQMEEQMKLTISQGLLISKELAIFDERNRAAISNQLADTLLKSAQSKKTKQETIHEVQKMIETVARTSGQKISNDIARRSADSIVEKTYRDSLGAARNLTRDTDILIGNWWKDAKKQVSDLFK